MDILGHRVNVLESIYAVTTGWGAIGLLRGRGPKTGGPTNENDVAKAMVEGLGKAAVAGSVADVLGDELVGNLVGLDLETLEMIRQVGDWYHLGGWPLVQQEINRIATNERDRWIGGMYGDIAQLDMNLTGWLKSAETQSFGYVDDYFWNQAPQAIIYAMLEKRRKYGNPRPTTVSRGAG